VPIFASGRDECLHSTDFDTNQQRKCARNADNQRRLYANVPERGVNTATLNTVFNTTIPLSDKQQRSMKSIYEINDGKNDGRSSNYCGGE
jgi:hypothetical protein